MVRPYSNQHYCNKLTIQDDKPRDIRASVNELVKGISSVQKGSYCQN
ncbi:unnamed protein product [Paramecium octaurelia]|uniref:Uncharacterized protein n=1 Tax=Paramecium octaurelia TaxID=43137 RepID=A0A8S1U1W3_PAROT|nr:unnamed protein product [Paramecium octaurelia]